MKKLLVFLFSLFLLSSASVFADDFIYHCNLDTHYKNSEGEPWKNKHIKYTFTLNNNKTISVFNHGINLKYDSLPIIYSQNSEVIIGLYQVFDKVYLLIIDKTNNFATFSISYTDNTISGEYGIGKCSLQ